MTDAEFEAQKERVRPLIPKWAAALGLHEFEIKTVYERECDKECPSHIMSVDHNSSYLWATVHVWTPQLLDMSDEDVEETVVHEMVHVFFGMMLRGNGHREDAERCTVRLARALMRLSKGA